MTAKFDLATLDAIVARTASKPDQPQVLMLGPTGIATMKAAEHTKPFEDAGADRRRIKREWRKSFRKAFSEARGAYSESQP